jgi:DNA replication and repair protein RecF
MYLRHLSVRGVRNLAPSDLKFQTGLNVFLGENGAGKTSALESISIALTGTSFRTPDLKEVVSTAAPALSVTADLEHEGVSHRIHRTMTPAGKTVLVDGKRASSQSLYSFSGQVTFDPQSLAAIQGGPQERRSILDAAVQSVWPETSRSYSSLYKCLRARNRTLRTLKDNPSDPSVLAVLESLNPLFLDLAAEVVALRLLYLKMIAETYAQKVGSLLGKSGQSAGFSYGISDKTAIDWDKNQVYDALKSRMQELAAPERSFGQSLVGPQRHDVVFLYAGQDSRKYCSQGQQRSLVLAFKMAQIRAYQEERGLDPVLLLDDVLSELDDLRQSAFLGELSRLTSQVFLSGTHLDPRLSLSRESVFWLQHGQVTKKDYVSVGESNSTEPEAEL